MKPWTAPRLRVYEAWSQRGGRAGFIARCRAMLIDHPDWTLKRFRVPAAHNGLEMAAQIRR